MKSSPSFLISYPERAEPPRQRPQEYGRLDSSAPSQSFGLAEEQRYTYVRLG